MALIIIILTAWLLSRPNKPEPKNVLVFDNIVRKMLAKCKEENKKSAILTLEQVGKFEDCNIILKVIPKE